MTFKVDRVPAVNRQLHELVKIAKARRIGDAYVDSLRRILSHLETHPLEWGDPLYHTKLPGGIVCAGIEWPLRIRFAVYTTQQVVVIIDVAPMPGSPLAEP